MNQAVLSLTDSTTQDPALSGSKGANLARMASAGLPVPRFFVVTTDVFTKATAGVMPAITENLSLASETDMVSLQKASDSAQGLILDLKLPDDAIAEIWSAYETIMGKSRVVGIR